MYVRRTYWIIKHVRNGRKIPNKLLQAITRDYQTNEIVPSTFNIAL